MDDLITLVRTYRLTQELADRLRLGSEIFRLIEPDLRLFVFSRVSHHAGQDALQEVLKGIATGMKKFAGSTEKEFWAWCYAIARNQLNNHYREKAADLIEPVPTEELWQLMDISAQYMPMTAQNRHDLEYVMKLLSASKPECYDLLWKHYVHGFDYAEIAAERSVTYDNARMKIGRCLEAAKSLAC